MGANYSFDLISTKTYAFQFIAYNNLFLSSVQDNYQDRVPSILPYKFWPLFWQWSKKKIKKKISQLKKTKIFKTIA